MLMMEMVSIELMLKAYLRHAINQFSYAQLLIRINCDRSGKLDWCNAILILISDLD